jgi:glycosyltransferase involved in cell wall biosynthesis
MSATRVLYAHSSALIGGGNVVLLRLFDAIDRSRYQPTSIIPEPGPMEQQLRTRDVRHAVVDVRPNSRSSVRHFASVARVAALTLIWRVGILHANDPYTYRAASLAVAPIGAKRVAHVHHPDVSAETLAWSFQLPPHLVITPSKFVKSRVDTLIRQPNRSRVETVWNPIDTDWFRPAEDRRELRRALNLAPDAGHVTILGALTPHKGHECFLRAARRVVDQLPATHFHVVGSAKSGSREHAESLRRLAGDLGIKERVRFWGWLSDARARDLLAASDVFMLPTREEGFGLVLAEAQACEIPVLTSSIRPLDEVVHDSVTGHLIPPDNAELFAALALDLLRSPRRRTDMGRHGRAWVTARFSPAAFIARITELYASLRVQTSVRSTATGNSDS